MQDIGIVGGGISGLHLGIKLLDLLAPQDYFLGLIMAMASNQPMCDEFTEGFADPEHLWFDIVKDAATAEAFTSSHRTLTPG